MGSDGLSDHRKAVAVYLEGKESSLSSSPSFNGGVEICESKLLPITWTGIDVLSMLFPSFLEERMFLFFFFFFVRDVCYFQPVCSW